jgi:hypothetical protein
MFKAIIVCALILAVFAHMRWVHPIPRNSNTGIKKYPCGDDGFWGSGQKVTTLQPGEQILKWEETINHKGAPFQIAISVGSDDHYQRMIVVDHIPHNDEGGGSFITPKPYSFKVTIPDINW